MVEESDKEVSRGGKEYRQGKSEWNGCLEKKLVEGEQRVEKGEKERDWDEYESEKERLIPLH